MTEHDTTDAGEGAGRRPAGPLRKGWTTGACATAAAVAAFRGLVTGAFPDPVTIALPKGLTPSFALSRAEAGDGFATAGVIKDAGDDPDVTHGAEIVVTVRRAEVGSGIRYAAGEGVGTVTRAGLPLGVGEPAINPRPREMIEANLRTAAAELGVAADLEVTVAVPGGAAMAARTMNGRLGILGGISILGTTGVVIPYSCSSWIHSIHRGIDVARANGVAHIAAATGSTSEAAVRDLYGLPDMALIDMGDFAGGMLKYLRDHPVPRLSLAGGFGKLAKLAQGSLDLHSSRSRVDFAALARLAREAGGGDDAAARIGQANSAMEALAVAAAADVPLADAVARRARETALATLAGGVAVEVLVVDRQGRIAGRADG